MLDSCRYKNNRALGFPEAGGAFSASTRAWIRAVAEQARKDGAFILAAMHHSIMDHHPMIHEGFTIDEAELFQDLLAEEGIAFVLSGHIHAQEISMRERPLGAVYDIATSAFSVYPHQIGTLRFTNEGSAARWRYQVQKLDVETWAAETGITDRRFRAFNEWSKAFFTRASESMVRREAAISGEELRILSELMAVLNLRYFSGTSHLNAADPALAGAYKLLEEKNNTFLSEYARTIMEARAPPDTELDVYVEPGRKR
jgi:hypothetical protein